jgi:hypothetical protein
MTTTWHAFVGWWPPTTGARVIVDRHHLAWQHARRLITDHVRPATTDGCPHCAADAENILGELHDLPEDTEWAGQLDGNDLRIKADPDWRGTAPTIPFEDWPELGTTVDPPDRHRTRGIVIRDSGFPPFPATYKRP